MARPCSTPWTSGACRCNRASVNNSISASGPAVLAEWLQSEDQTVTPDQVLARVESLARSTPVGEWIVTMPIGDPPFYEGVRRIHEGRRRMTLHLRALHLCRL